MMFFTDKSTINSNFLMIPLKDYKKKTEEFLSHYSKIIIDTGVLDLLKYGKYLNLSELEEKIQNLKENEYMTLDYPPKFLSKFLSDENCVELTFEYNMKFNLIKNAIWTIQYIPHNFDSFHDEVINSQYAHKHKIIAIPENNENTKFFMEMIELINKLFKNRHIHFFGLNLKHIKMLGKYLSDTIEYSVDSTKWTRAVTSELKKKYGLNCNSSNRSEFFIEYMKQIAITTQEVSF